MRELEGHELALVSGAGNLQCSPGDGNSYGGVNDPGGFGQDLIAFYEGLVFATSHMIERVANAL